MAPRDRVVYLGNYVGLGAEVGATLDELIAFRRWLLARPVTFLDEIAYLRGAQEEMWSKLLQLHFAPNPGEVLRWLLAHGAAATLACYGGDSEQGLRAAREGALALTRWTGSLRTAVSARPGHTPFFSSLRRAAFTGDRRLLFVHAGIDPNRPLHAQSDSFWWASGAFGRIEQPFEGFGTVVRGFDPAKAGLHATACTLSLDAGCGRGGSLLAVRLDPDGTAGDVIEA